MDMYMFEGFFQPQAENRGGTPSDIIMGQTVHTGPGVREIIEAARTAGGYDFDAARAEYLAGVGRVETARYQATAEWDGLRGTATDPNAALMANPLPEGAFTFPHGQI